MPIILKIYFRNISERNIAVLTSFTDAKGVVWGSKIITSFILEVPLCACMGVRACVFVYTMYQEQTQCMYSPMPRADLQPRADTLDVCFWFWYQIRTRHP